ncbi:hypothetical protein CsSME_00012276 [Camellia sinensis var. sinensis]
MASAFGVQCHVYCNTGGIITTFGFIGSMWWLFLTSPWKEVSILRHFCYLFVRKFLFLRYQCLQQVKIIIAFVGSAIGFVSFSLAAMSMSSQNRARFYLLGLFSSDLLNLIWLLRASTYGGYSALFMVDCLIMCLNLIHCPNKYHAKLYMYLYFELLLSYLVFNSQGIIVQARCGDVCYVHHALTFFTDFPAVVIGLIRNKKKCHHLKNRREEEEEEVDCDSQGICCVWYIDLGRDLKREREKVYHTLCCALLISAFGIYLHVLWNIGGISTTLGFIGSMGWLFSMAPWKERTRVELLMFAALCIGASIGHLLELVMIAPSKVITAYLGTAMAFCCFAEAITTSQDRVYIYVLGVLSSNLSILIGLLLASIFFGVSIAIFPVDSMCLYFELLLWYMVLDSQAIIVHARHGDVYCVHHALTFFTDLPALLIGIIRNIWGNNVRQPPAEEQRRRRRRSGRRDFLKDTTALLICRFV